MSRAPASAHDDSAEAVAALTQCYALIRAIGERAREKVCAEVVDGTADDLPIPDPPHDANETARPDEGRTAGRS